MNFSEYENHEQLAGLALHGYSLQGHPLELEAAEGGSTCLNG